MKQFDTNKFKEWVDEQGGWQAVADLAKNSPFYSENYNVHFVYNVKFNPFKTLEGEQYWLLLGLNINDFLEAETVDGCTALEVLVSGGVVWNNGFYHLSPRGIILSAHRNPDFEDHSIPTAFWCDCEYEVVSWGDYKK